MRSLIGGLQVRFTPTEGLHCGIGDVIHVKGVDPLNNRFRVIRMDQERDGSIVVTLNPAPKVNPVIEMWKVARQMFPEYESEPERWQKAAAYCEEPVEVGACEHEWEERPGYLPWCRRCHMTRLPPMGRG